MATLIKNTRNRVTVESPVQRHHNKEWNSLFSSISFFCSGTTSSPVADWGPATRRGLFCVWGETFRSDGNSARLCVITDYLCVLFWSTRSTLDLPIRRGEVLLLLESLLQPHQLELREHRPTAPALLGLAAVGAVVLQLAAEVEV